MSQYWGELIYRTVVETKDFTAPSNKKLNVQDIHKNIATKRRSLIVKDKDNTIVKSNFSDLNIIEISE
jgi:hypothetical protein